MMDKLLFACGLGLAFVGPIVAIVHKERLLRNGRVVILDLAPVDPRSLMQGDYMALNYAMVGNMTYGRSDGHLVLKDDANGVGRLVRVDDGSPLAPEEYRVRYRKRGWRVHIGGDAYFFQEGTAKEYQNARYGELRVSPGGEALLVGLRDSRKEPLGQKR